MLVEIFFRNHIYWDVFENLTFRNLPSIQYVQLRHTECIYVGITLHITLNRLYPQTYIILKMNISLMA